MVKNLLEILSRSHLLLSQQISIQVVAMVAEAEGKKDLWAMEDMEVVAMVVVTGKVSAMELVVVDSSELGTGSVLILYAINELLLEE